MPPMRGGGHMKGGGHMGGMTGGHRMGGMKGMPGGRHMGGMKGMPGGHHMGGMKGIPGAGHMKGWQRFGRGHFIPPHFRNRQFFVHNWQSFGWPAPMPGGQWIRYYDDALLIDREGRVMDSRYGWDWGRGGGRMAYDDGGYGEDYGGYEDDRYEDDYAGGDDYGYEGEEGDCRGGCGPVGHEPPPPRHPGYGAGYGYGSSYGYGYGAGCACGPVVVTETITTTAPVMETHTYYETVTRHRSAPRRHYSKPVVRRSVKPAYRAPAPRPGERG